MSRKPSVSVVVICHNGEATLNATLDSLMRQTYPRKLYEVILVDDASSDGTANIAKSYKRVRYVGLRKNRGISGARNAGLRAAKGEIYVCFDDDCVADYSWLTQLIKGYETGDPIGVGGRLVEPQSLRGITNRYISASDSNDQPQLNSSEAASKNPLRRFWRYLSCRITTTAPTVQKVEVTELYGANGSYKKNVLEKVGGWRETMSGIEDRDLSRRIRAAFPGRPFYVMSEAVITHDRGQTLRQYLLRPYKRGPVNLAFHRQNGIAPPLFPFPFVSAIALVVAAWLYPLALIPIAFVLPQLLYCWWGIRAVRCHRLVMALFPYIQLAEEAMVIAGLTRGYLLLARAWASRALSASLGFLNLLLALLVLAAATTVAVRVPSPWVRAAVYLPVIFTLPGYCGWLILKGKAAITEPLGRLLGYAVALSVLIIMIGGLLLNEAYGIFGYSRPFMLLPVVSTLGGVMAVLAGLAFRRTGRTFRLVRWHRPAAPGAASLAALVGVLLPALAVAGAVTLNNGGGSSLALVAMGGIAVLMIFLAFGGKSFRPYYGWFLYSMCASILLGTSMRGWNITGHDVMQEYQVFQLTLTHAAWHVQYYHDAYMACLSITILPTIIQVVTGMSAPFVFKVVTQLIIALLAPVMYGIFRDYTTRRRALLATYLFMFFPTFLTDITMLNRQGIALVFFALSLQAGLDRQLSRRQKSLLGFSLLVGIVLSHYSTSYVAIGSLLLALGCAAAWRLVRRFIRRRQPAELLTSIFHAPVIIAALFALIAWGSFATQTSNNISRTFQGVTTTLRAQLTGKAAVPAAVRPVTIDQYAALMTASRILPASAYYSSQTVAAHPLLSSPETIAPVSSAVSRIGIAPATLTAGYNVVRSVYALVIEGLIVIGLAVAFLRKRHFKLPLQWLFVGAGMITLIVVQIAVPSAINYGLTRLLQQGLIILALPMVLAYLWVLRRAHVPRRFAEDLLAVMLALFFLVLSGLLPAITGGFKPVLALSNSGFYYEAYYTHQEEIAAALWLNHATPLGSRVYSDEFTRRKLITYANIFGQPTLSPGAIPVDSYVMLGYGNEAFNQVPVYVGPNLEYYQPPLDFLNNNKNLVYSSDNVAIYR